MRYFTDLLRNDSMLKNYESPRTREPEVADDIKYATVHAYKNTLQGSTQWGSVTSVYPHHQTSTGARQRSSSAQQYHRLNARTTLKQLRYDKLQYQVQREHQVQHEHQVLRIETKDRRGLVLSELFYYLYALISATSIPALGTGNLSSEQIIRQ